MPVGFAHKEEIKFILHCVLRFAAAAACDVHRDPGIAQPAQMQPQRRFIQPALRVERRDADHKNAEFLFHLFTVLIGSCKAGS